jgi:hypothetical protein
LALGTFRNETLPLLELFALPPTSEATVPEVEESSTELELLLPQPLAVKSSEVAIRDTPVNEIIRTIKKSPPWN